LIRSSSLMTRPYKHRAAISGGIGSALIKAGEKDGKYQRYMRRIPGVRR